MFNDIWVLVDVRVSVGGLDRWSLEFLGLLLIFIVLLKVRWSKKYLKEKVKYILIFIMDISELNFVFYSDYLGEIKVLIKDIDKYFY